MTVEDYHDFFVAAASVAGALIGLLFVAISVSLDRLSAGGDAALHRVRASAALTTFTNALVVSLFGLVPHTALGTTVFAVAIIGLTSVAASLIALARAHAIHLRSLRDLFWLAGLTTVFVVQLVTGLQYHGHESGSLQTLSTLVVACFLIGIARAWELIGGPSIELRKEVGSLGRDVGSRLLGDDRDTTGRQP